MLALIDLYYHFNRKRATCLASPEEVLRACLLFPAMQLRARVATYENNIKVVESSIS